MTPRKWSSIRKIKTRFSSCYLPRFLLDYPYMSLNMSLTTQKVEEIARLARLELTEVEKMMYAEQLSVVLEYIEMLDEVKTDGVAETCQVTGLEDVVREDKVEACDLKVVKKIIAAFPNKKGNLLKVKAVFDYESE